MRPWLIVCCECTAEEVGLVKRLWTSRAQGMGACSQLNKTPLALTPLGPRPSVLRDLCWQPIVFLGPLTPFRSTETLRERREVDGSNS